MFKRIINAYRKNCLNNCKIIKAIEKKNGELRKENCELRLYNDCVACFTKRQEQVLYIDDTQREPLVVTLNYRNLNNGGRLDLSIMCYTFFGEDLRPRKEGAIHLKINCDKYGIDHIFIVDVVVRLVNHSYGSLMMEQCIKFVKNLGVKKIVGNLSQSDLDDHGDRLYHFYEKFGFKIETRQIKGEKEEQRVILNL